MCLSKTAHSIWAYAFYFTLPWVETSIDDGRAHHPYYSACLIILTRSGFIPGETCPAHGGQRDWLKKSSTPKITDRPCAGSSVSWFTMHFSTEEHKADGPRQSLRLQLPRVKFLNLGTKPHVKYTSMFGIVSVTKIVRCRSDEKSVA